MLSPTVTKVMPQDNQILYLEFDNGERKQFNVKPYITGSWFEKLSDDTYFKTVNPNGFTIEWVDG